MKILLIKSGFNLFFFHLLVWLSLATNFLTFLGMEDFVNRRANRNNMALLSLLQIGSLQHAFVGTLSTSSLTHCSGTMNKNSGNSV